MYNTKGESKEKSITISNIDKENPSGSCSGYYKSGISQIEVKANDNVGIGKYIIDGTTYTSSSIKLNKEVSSVNITIYDKAGNSKAISCNLTDKNPKTTTTTTTTTTTKTTIQVTTGVPLTDVPEISSKYPSRKYNKNITLNYYKGKKGFSYWMYVPDNATTNLPLIIFLPGYGSPQGNDYYMNDPVRKGAGIAYGPIRDVIDYGYSYNAIVIHAQLPKDNKVYDYISSYVSLIDRIAEVYKIDKKKISAMGLSHGCYGVGYFVEKYPTYLSAAVPMGCNLQIYDAKKFTSTPLWAFSGKGDGLKEMPKFVDEVNSLGGNAKFTHPDGAPHHLMKREYSVLRDKKYKIIDWMISQTRN